MAYRIVFFGTSDFSVPTFRAILADKRFEVVAAVTQPDKPVGRHQEVTPPPVKVLAQENTIPVYQFEKVKSDEAFETLKALNMEGDFGIDVYVVISFGQIMPQRILDLPKKGCINVHGSLLPRWRGASCVQAAISAGDQATGVTIMLMDALMDHGSILAQREAIIRPDDTGGSLHDRLAELGAKSLPDVLADYLEGKIQPQEQNHELATTCKILSRDHGKIDWNKPADEIERLIRAYDPWPGTFTVWNEKRIKILVGTKSSVVSHLSSVGMPEEVEGKIMVRCGDGQVLEILKLQPEGKKAMNAKEYLAGHSL